jgi:hypothetical protein
MKRILLLVILFAIEFNIYSQRNTFLSYELGLTKPEFYVFNPQKDITKQIERGIFEGIVLNQEIFKSINVELGFNYHLCVNQYVSYKNVDTTSVFFDNEEFQIPIRLQYRKTYFEDKLQVFLSSGTILCLALKDSPVYGSGSTNRSTNLTDVNYNFINNHALLELGAGADIFITKNFFLGLRYKYTVGFKQILNYEAYAMDANSSRSDYVIRTNGNCHSLSIGLGYRISSIWNKSK